MKSVYVSVLVACMALAAHSAMAQVAGKTTLGIAVAEVDLVASGWSAKKQILGRQVVERAPLPPPRHVRFTRRAAMPPGEFLSWTEAYCNRRSSRPSIGGISKYD